MARTSGSTSTAAFRYLLLAVLALACTLSPRAQVSGGRADISGRVTDSTGVPISGAIITIRDMQQGTARTLRSDGSGYYTAPALEVGTYTVEAHAATFADTRIGNVTLTVGSSIAIDLKLQPGSVGTTVEVSADTDATRRTEVDNNSLIDTAQVEDLPTRGRNFTDFALLTPGISQEGDRFGLVINGQRSSNLYISVDGIDFNDSLQGGQRGGNDSVYFFPQVAVREFQVVRTGATTEVGRTNGGFVNVVTKSGSNRFHGQALYSNRNPQLTWSDPFNNPDSDNVQNQYGFAIGGPIRTDKIFFFAGVEKNQLQTPFFVRFTTPSGYCETTITGAGQTPCAGSSGLTPLPAAVSNLETNAFGVNNPIASFGRLDDQLNDRNRLTLQYTSTFLNGLAFGSGGVQDASVSDNTILARQSQGFVLGLTSIFGGTRTNDAKFQYAYDNRRQTPVSPDAEIDIGDLGTIGGAGDGTFIYRSIRYEFLDNYSWQLGKHSLRFGFDINISPQTQQREPSANGLWTIDTFQHYLQALPQNQGGSGLTPTQVNASCGGKASSPCIQFAQTLPANGSAELRYRGTQHEFAGYIQDSFRIVPRLTLNLGFRYDAQLEPQPAATNLALPQTGIIPNDLTMFQPRIGIAYDIFGNGKTVLRASGGLLDARTPAYLIQRVFTDNGLTNDSLNSIYNPALLNTVAYLGQLTAPPSGLALINDVYVMEPGFKNPRSAQAALSITQEFDHHTVLTVGFVQNETQNLQHRLDTNLFTPTVNATTLYPVFPKINPITGIACTLGGVAVPCRPNSTIAGYHVNYASGHSTYRGLQTQLSRQFTHKFSGAFSYTWASARDDDSNERDFNRELALDPLCTACYNKGYSKQDIRSSGNIRGLYRLPLGFTYSSTLAVRTGLPWNATLSGSNADQNNDGNTNNDRPILCGPAFTVCTGGVVTGRNTFRQPGFLNWDMRLFKSFTIHEGQRLQISAEGLNVTQATNENFGNNAESKFGKAQSSMNAATGFYYSNAGAGIPTSSPATNRSGGPRQIQLGAKYTF